MATNNYYSSSTSTGASNRMYSIYRMSDAQPDWAETDPSQPDYIKNREQVERFRPISVNGEVFLDDTYQSGNLNFVGGKNIILAVSGNDLIISTKSSGGGSTEGGECECPEYIAGTGINIAENIYGQQEISIKSEVIAEETNKIVAIALEKYKNENDLKIAAFETSLAEHTSQILILSQKDTALTELINSNATAINNLTKKVDTGEKTVATFVNDAIKSVVDTIDLTGYAKTEDVENLITKVDEHDAILFGIGGENQPATVIAAIEAAKHVLPVATADILGGIKSAADVGDKIAINKVYVDATTNIAEVKAFSTDNLVQGSMILVLNGGDNAIIV